MSRKSGSRGAKVATKSKRGALAVGLAFALLGLLPAAASAHGPIAPVASDFLARIQSTPPGLKAVAVDGDLRMYLSVPAGDTVIVVDYRTAPYLRFGPGGVYVNTNSAMYYLNLTPVAQPPPPNLTARTRPHWVQVTGGHSYQWHDGRLHALAAVARRPGVSFVGRWRVPLIVNGRPASVVGSLSYANRPPLIWFWPIVVIFVCVLAAWRLRRPELDARVARVLEGAALIAVALVGIGIELHGRPSVTPFQLVKLAAILAFVGICAWRLTRGRSGYFAYFLIGCAAVWGGVELLPTLRDGYVLIALPGLLARVATVVCLGGGVSLLLIFARLADRRSAGDDEEPELEEDGAWELV